jgi:hypothetical protein
VAVVLEARDDVPVHVRRHVAEARDVDLVGMHRLADRALDREDHAHQRRALGFVEIGELAAWRFTITRQKPG